MNQTEQKTEQKTKIPNLYKNKKYNLLYLIKTHQVYKNWKINRTVENIIDNLEQRGFDQLSERALYGYLYVKKDVKDLEIKYSYLKELANELNCTIDNIVDPIETIYGNS